MTIYYNQIIIKPNILLLQGPVGPFFSYFADFCIDNNVSVHKITFHYGEAWFYKHPQNIFKEDVHKWQKYFTDYVLQHNIQQIFLIGTHKIYHKIAIEYCKQHGIEIIVFEEGYIRSGFITVEKDGVNGNTSIPREPNVYYSYNTKHQIRLKQTNTLNTFAKLYNKFIFFYKYSFGLFITQWAIPNYKHHMPAKGIKTFIKWNKFYLSSIYHTILPFEKEKNTKWLYENQNQYYIAILQINTDSAITEYSTYNSMGEFITEVMSSFAMHAPKHTKLIIKHHPYDRGIHDYTNIINRLTKQLHLQTRIKYIIDLHLDLGLELSLGCILINSTTGYSSIERGIKTIALSKNAVFNIKGLTYQGSLSSFWNSEEKPDQKLYTRFKNYVIYHSQMRGCFYGGEICDFNKKFIFE